MDTQDRSYPVPNPACAECGGTVLYSKRRKCLKCRAWCHGDCMRPVAGTCRSCRPVEAPELERSQFEAEAAELAGSLGIGEESMLAFRVVYAGLWAGASVEAVCGVTGLSEEAVTPLAANLESSGVWRDGVTVMGPDDPETLPTELVLMVLCAEGKVRRAKA